jgi:serine/threonine kinase PknH
VTVPPPSDPRQPNPLESDGEVHDGEFHNGGASDGEFHDGEPGDSDAHEDTGPLRVPTEPPLGQPDWEVRQDEEWLAESGVDPLAAAPPVSGPAAPAPPLEHASRPIRRFEPHDEGPWSGGFQPPPPPVIPRVVTARAKPNISVRPIAIAVAIVVVLGGLGYWMFGSSDDASPTEPSATTTSATPVADARERLRTLLPPGYSEAACEPVATPKGAVAKFGCERNSDEGGPPLATYTLVADKAALKAAFEDIIKASNVVVCPGSIQSPGPWRRNATPQKVAGTLFCGYQRDLPTVAWTDDAELLVSAIRGDEKGPSLPQLYAWWTSHS